MVGGPMVNGPSIDSRLTINYWQLKYTWSNSVMGWLFFFYYPLSVDRLHVITSLPLCWRMITKDSSLAFSSSTWLTCLCHETLGIYSNGSTGPQRGEEGRGEWSGTGYETYYLGREAPSHKIGSVYFFCLFWCCRFCTLNTDWFAAWRHVQHCLLITC